MRYQKILCAMLVCGLAFSLAGCGKKEESGKVSETSEVSGKAEMSDASGTKESRTVIFGTYEQDNDTANGAEAIEWLVLDETEDGILVVSKYGLDCERYQPNLDLCDWEETWIRGWLYETFYETAFTAEEKEMINEVTLLTETQAKQYFEESKDRICFATDYAIEQGAAQTRGFNGEEDGHVWWLRRDENTPNSDDAYSYVRSPGNVEHASYGSGDKWRMIRPALLLKKDAV